MWPLLRVDPRAGLPLIFRDAYDGAENLMTARPRENALQ